MDRRLFKKQRETVEYFNNLGSKMYTGN